MKSFISNTNTNRKKLSIKLMIILALSTTILLAGCNSKDDQEQIDTIQNEEVSVQTTEHMLDTEATPLSEADKLLTLEGYGAVGALLDENLSVTDMLMYAVQDEYLAHGEYLAIIEKFGSQKPYDNIIKAEETHLSFLQEVYQIYELEFPTDSSLDHIVVPADLLEAAKTGVQAEIDNIAMYEKFLSYDLPENVVEVFNALKDGSESHLLAFEKQVDKLSN